VVRFVEGVTGWVPMRMELRLWFDNGRVVPCVRRETTEAGQQSADQRRTTPPVPAGIITAAV
jgi:hypothetical protein